MVEVSVCVGGIARLPASGSLTGMYKAPVRAPVALGPEGFAGDVQADRRFHGGPEKAVHLYPAEHYAALAAQFPEAAPSLVPGAMGENLSCEGLDEQGVRLGEIWQLGTARLQVSQPRNPCWKIDERFACDGMAAYIAQTLRTGWYWRVLQPGRVVPGDGLERVAPACESMTLHEALALWREHRPPLDALARLVATPGIAPEWRDKIRRRLAYLRAQA